MSKYNIFSIDNDLPFVDTLVSGLWTRINKDLTRLRKSMIFVPHRRAVRVFEDAFVRLMDGKAVILPQINAIGDADDTEQIELSEIASHETDSGVPIPAIPNLRRQILLTQLIRRYLEANSSDEKISSFKEATLFQASRLADDLSKLLDRMQTENIPFNELEGLAPDIYAEHWQKTITFLKIITEAWPKILKDEGAIDPATHRNEKLNGIISFVKQQTLEDQIIVAGSTGSIPATADFMRVVASLPNGAVVLPGLDKSLSNSAWEAVLNDITHPQHVLSKLLFKLSISSGDISDWLSPDHSVSLSRMQKSRMRLMSEVMRPAITTEHWHNLNSNFISGGDLDGITLLECRDFQSEASTIALILRETLETSGKTASLITSDRSLARRVKSEMKRWGINIDDSAGTPLVETPLLVFWRLVGKMVEEGLAPIPFLATMKHPLARGGKPIGVLKKNIRLLERLIFRGPRPPWGIDGLIETLQLSLNKDTKNSNSLNATDKEKSDLYDWIVLLSSSIRELEKLIKSPSVKIKDIFERHNNLVEILLAGDSENSPEQVYFSAHREQVTAAFSDIFSMSHDFPEIPGYEYLSFLESLLSSATFRPPFGTHPRLSILGPLEGRLLHFDRVILGGLNEGSWPPEPQADPWMSRPMRSAIGLSLPEIRIGQSAHDFVQACGTAEVFLTRSKRINGTPTVASRWLLRMSALIKSLNYNDTFNKAKGDWIGWQEALDMPKQSRRILPPLPRPLLSQRPRSFSVTQIGTWIRNPYSIYAREILKLRPLDTLDAEPIAVDRGNFTHKALENFIKAGIPGDIEEAKKSLIQHGRSAFGTNLDHPAVWAFWWPRFLKTADWFVEMEKKKNTIITRNAEVLGNITLSFPFGPVELRAKADRIDQEIGNVYTIIDYKTGGVPPKRDLLSGLAPQLPLEALILREGGFSGTSSHTCAQLKYIELKGGNPPGREELSKENIDNLINITEEGLRRLILAFDNDDTPYLAHPDPNNKLNYDDYEHLSRFKEWSS